MPIYTKTGDQGTTSLASGRRVSKTDARIEAYGTVDELNSFIGLLRAGTADKPGQGESDRQLAWIQNKLFNLGAALSEAPGEWITAGDVQQVEQWIDAMQAVIPQQRAFLLPSGSEPVCRCHICRTVCRRAERRMLEIVSMNPHKNALSSELKFINRLSDYLFVLARYIGFSLGETEQIWQK